MTPFYAFMGGVAKASGRMSRFSINFIPSNWILIGACLILSFVFWGGFLKDRDAIDLVGALLLLISGCAFIGSSLLRHIIFQKLPAPATDPAALGATSGAAAPASDAGLNVPMRLTGRLRLSERVAQRFLDIPVGLERLENGQLALMSNIDASSRFYGAVVNSKSGLWLSILNLNTLEVDDGALYHGFKGAPSLLLRYTDEADGKPVQNILAFTSARDRDVVRAALQSERARH